MSSLSFSVVLIDDIPSHHTASRPLYAALYTPMVLCWLWLEYEKFTNKLKKKFILGFDRFFFYTISMVYFKFNQLLSRMTNRNDKASLNYLQLKMVFKRTSLLSQLFNFLMIFYFPFVLQFSFSFSINSDFYFMGIIQVSFIRLPL